MKPIPNWPPTTPRPEPPKSQLPPDDTKIVATVATLKKMVQQAYYEGIALGAGATLLFGAIILWWWSNK